MLETRPARIEPSLTGDTQPLAGVERTVPLGQLLCQSKGLDPAEIDRMLAYQREQGGRLGEAAIALGLATQDEVIELLARQFDYPFVRSFEDGVRNAELVCACDPFGEDAELFRELRTELLMGALGGSQPPALAIVSPQAEDGRSYVAANLALSLAQLGGRVLLVDADLKTPRQHALFGISDATGLSKILSGSSTFRHLAQPAPSCPGLFVMPAGPIPPNPLELLQRPVFRQVIHEWRSTFDHVVIDTPASAHGPQARVIAAATGAALAIARPQVTRTQAFEQLLSALEKGRGLLAGVVLNEH